MLSRSTLEEMRSKATKRSEEMIELRSSRAAQNTAVSHLKPTTGVNLSIYLFINVMKVLRLKGMTHKSTHKVG